MQISEKSAQRKVGEWKRRKLSGENIIDKHERATLSVLSLLPH